MPRLSQGIWILPSLGRAEGLACIAEDVRRHDPEARVVIVLSGADATPVIYPKEWETILIDGFPSTTEKINEAFARFPNEAFYGLLANDLRIESPRALTMLAGHCPSYGLSFCDDQVFGAKISGYPCVDGDLIRALGWWAYPRLRHHFVDLVLWGIAKRHGGAKYMSGIKFRHNHYTMGTAEFDSTYAWGKDQERADIAASVYWARNDKEPTNERIKELRLAVTT